MNAGPLVAIIVGLMITAAGVWWQVHLARAPKPASLAQATTAPIARPEAPPANPAPQVGAGASPEQQQASTEPKPAAPASEAATAAPPAPQRDAKVPQAPAIKMLASADMSDAQFKSATTAFTEQMKAFEQSYDSRRLEILEQRTDTQSERDQQVDQLKALQNEKVSGFTREILPHAQFLQAELTRRLQLRGIGDVPLPPPPAGISIAIGRQILQMDVSDVGLQGHRPVTGLASYLELLASKLPD
jgi:hypothetical protein